MPSQNDASRYLYASSVRFPPPASEGTSEGAADVWLDQAIRDTLITKSWEERQEAHKRLLSLGREALKAAVARLAIPQAPEVVDLLVDFLAVWAPVDPIISAAQDRNLPPRLRAGLAQVLAAQWHDSVGAEAAQLGSLLCALAKDGEAAVRLAAVDGLGSREDLGDQAIRTINQIAESDESSVVREEANRVLEDLGV